MNLALSHSTAHHVLLANYAAGLLPAPAHALVSAHLELRPENRSYVEALEGFAADAMDGTEPVALSARERSLQAIFDSAPASAPQPARSRLPHSLSRFIGHAGDDLPWKPVVPGFKEWDLGEHDNCEVHMYWIKPGGKVPSHTHDGTELFLVLEGSFTDETGTYRAGDISIADENVDHRPVAGLEGPCIGFAVNDGPLRLTGSLGQRIGMLFGI